MENHIRSVDVVATGKEGKIISVGEAEEFYIIMDKADGVDYFNDIKKIGENNNLHDEDRNKALALARFLAKLHKNKFKKNSLYKRKIRDTIGGGASTMGVMDMYPENLSWFPKNTQIKIVQKSIECWMRDKFKSDRLCRVHGDFHPGNIWFKNSTDFVLLDRARGEFGEAADDITALFINYIFYSLIFRNDFSGSLKELAEIFISEYFKLTKDNGMGKIIQPYWAFRAIVLCNPAFYPDSFFANKSSANKVRKKIINFAVNILNENNFNWKKINQYLDR